MMWNSLILLLLTEISNKRENLCQEETKRPHSTPAAELQKR